MDEVGVVFVFGVVFKGFGKWDVLKQSLSFFGITAICLQNLQTKMNRESENKKMNHVRGLYSQYK